MVEDKDYSAAIEKMTEQGIINGGDVKKLQDAGIRSCNDLMMHTKENLPEITGLSKAKVDQIWETAEKIVALNEEANQMQQLIAGDTLFVATQNSLNEEANQMQQLNEEANQMQQLNEEALNEEITEALLKTEKKLTQTMSNIGRRAQRDRYYWTRNRIEVLKTTIAIKARSKTQIEHWKREQTACEKRLRNMERNNF